MDKKILGAGCGILAVFCLLLWGRYNGEVQRSRLLSLENQKTVTQSEEEIRKLEKDLKDAREKSTLDVKKSLDQIDQLTREKNSLRDELEKTARLVDNERANTKAAEQEARKFSDDVIRLARKNQDDVAAVERSLRKKVHHYEARILALEAALEKTKTKLQKEAERFHYQLGVIYSQDKEFDLAVTEFRTVLGYNPKNAQAHYNLGVIYDDYFKDKENARIHYRSFLDLNPKPEDAEAVREWLANLDK